MTLISWIRGSYGPDFTFFVDYFEYFAYINCVNTVNMEYVCINGKLAQSAERGVNNAKVIVFETRTVKK